MGAMSTYVAFLRAINLGAKRKFPKDAIKSAAEEAGFTEVATYINTGNVRLETRMRSRARIEEALEAAFLADRGFEVPTMVFAPAEICEIADDAEELAAEVGSLQGHYITLLKQAPSAAAVKAVHELEYDGESARVRGRAAHLMLTNSYTESKLVNAKPFTALGVGTARNLTVIRALAEKWCGG
jgi:uncharacterized protein (DUF1697 family)